METYLTLLGLCLLIGVIIGLSRWMPDVNDSNKWPFPPLGSQERMEDEVAIMRENQKSAIATRRLVELYAKQMRYAHGVGQRRGQAISQAYVHKVEEITRS